MATSGNAIRKRMARDKSTAELMDEAADALAAAILAHARALGGQSDDADRIARSMADGLLAKVRRHRLRHG